EVGTDLAAGVAGDPHHCRCRRNRQRRQDGAQYDRSEPHDLSLVPKSQTTFLKGYEGVAKVFQSLNLIGRNLTNGTRTVLPSRERPLLFDLYLGRADDLAPALHLGRDEGGEFLRSSRLGIGAELAQGGAQLGRGDGLVNGRVQP